MERGVMTSPLGDLSPTQQIAAAALVEPADRRTMLLVLAARVADGLPAPDQISFGGDDGLGVWLNLASANDLTAWARALDVPIESPLDSARNGGFIHRAGSSNWRGWYVCLRALEPYPSAVESAEADIVRATVAAILTPDAEVTS